MKTATRYPLSISLLHWLLAVALTGNYHLMFMGLKQPLTEGQNIAITLKIKLSSGHVETLSIQAPVKSLAHSAMHQ